MADETSSTRIAHEVALWRLQEQLSYGAALDSRLASSFALAAAMVALLGSALLFADSADREATATAVTVAAGLFVANVVVSTAALLLSRWILAPNLDELLGYSEGISGDELARWTAEAVASAVEENGARLEIKSQLVNLAIVLTGATAIAVSIAVFLLV